MHPQFGYGVPRRPEMPYARPHTVHGSSQDFNEEDVLRVEEEDDDDQTTPRASMAGLRMAAHHGGGGLQRDDTAADVFMGAPSHMQEVLQPTRYVQPFGPQDQFRAWADAGAFAQNRVQAQPQMQHMVTLPSNAHQQVVESQPKPVGQVQSLGRRFSRTYKEKISGLRDGIRHAPLRIRRASTPHNAENAAQPSGGFIDPRQLVAPSSPSKRTARYGDYRTRKFRNTFGLPLSDRKDTPAPPAFGIASRPAPRPVTASVWQQLPGGDGARQAAAAYKHGVRQDGTWSQQEESLQTRRARVGSLSSAADSGTDLPYDDDLCKDSVGDVEEMDLDEEFCAQPEPKRVDFVQALPSELALQIFEYLDARELLHAQRASRSWHVMANETSVWKKAFLSKYDRKIYTDPAPIQVGGIGSGRFNKSKQEWQRMYKARLELERNWRRGPKEAGKAVYLSGHTDSVYCVQFDEDKIITGSRDRTIRVWDINTFQCLKVIGGPNVKPAAGPKVLRTVDYPHFHLATASVNGTPYGESIYHVPSYWHDASILCLQYDDKILVTGSSDSDLIVWDIKTYEPIKRLHKHTGGVLDVALDANHIISCSKDSRIIVWDRTTLEPKGDLTGHRGPVNAVQLRGKYLVSASGDGIARLWDIDQMKLVKEFAAKERGLAAVEFSEDMQYVLAGGNDHITYKFEVATGKEVTQFTGHTQLVRSLWLDSANNRVVSGSYDLDLRIYDFVTGQEVWRAEEWTTSWMLAAKSDYRRIVATSQDGRILIIDFGLQKGGFEDGQPILDVDLLRGIENTNAIVFRDPWKS